MGYSWGDSGLLCTSEDLFKVGRLFKNGGRAAGEMLINSDFVGAAISSCGSSCIGGNQYGSGEYGYGYQIWREQDGGFGFHGMGMQYMICIPKLDFYLVCNADTQGHDNARAIFLDMYEDFVNEELHSEPLPENKAAYDDLVDYCSKLKLVSLSGDKASYISDGINGKTFTLANNKMGIKWFRLNFDGENGVFVYENSQGEKCLPFGICKNVITEFPEDGYANMQIGKFVEGYHHPCAVSAAWQDDTTFAIKAQMVGNHLGGLYIRIGFNENMVTLDMKKNTNCFLNEYDGMAMGFRA